MEFHILYIFSLLFSICLHAYYCKIKMSFLRTALALAFCLTSALLSPLSFLLATLLCSGLRLELGFLVDGSSWYIMVELVWWS